MPTDKYEAQESQSNAPDNPFLSEFDDHPWIRTIFAHKLGVVTCWVFFAIIIAVLSIYVCSACLRVELTPLAPLTEDKAVQGMFPMMVHFGYLAELNHGFLYTFLMPGIIFLAYRFFTKTHNAVTELSKQFGRLSLREQPTPPDPLASADQLQIDNTKNLIDYLRMKNKAIFSVTLWVIPALSVGIIYGTEFSVIELDAFGWVQFGRAEFKNKKLSEIRAELPPIIILQEDIILPCDIANINELVEVNLSYPPAGRLEKMIGTQQSRFLLFYTFLFAALTIEAISLMIYIWLTLKTLFVISLFAFAHWYPGNDSGKLGQFEPSLLEKCLPFLKNQLAVRINARDEGGRFGLMELDGVYNAILWLSMISIINWTLGQFSNYAKGNCGPLSYDLLSIQRPILGVVNLIPVILMAFFPLWSAWSISRRAKEYERDELKGNPTTNDNKIKQDINNNSVWPWKSASNLVIFLAFTGVFLMAFGVNFAAKLLPYEWMGKYLVQWAQEYPAWLCQFFEMLEKRF